MIAREKCYPDVRVCSLCVEPFAFVTSSTLSVTLKYEDLLSNSL